MNDPARPVRIDFSGFEAALRRKEASRRCPPVPTAIASRSRLTVVELT